MVWVSATTEACKNLYGDAIIRINLTPLVENDANMLSIAVIVC